MHSIKFISACCPRLIVLLLLLAVNVPAAVSGDPGNRELYQMKVYSYSSPSQEARLDQYLKEACLPALRRAGIRPVGVFKPVEGEDVGKKIYVLIPFRSMDQFLELPALLEKDREYLLAGNEYYNAPFDDPPYDRIGSTLMKAFSDMPKMKVPDHATPPGERIYELRSYESATEELYKKKVHMFNEGGELRLFERLDFKAVFYGDVISGSTMPNLVYMTTFPNRAVRDEYWNIFRVDPEWMVMRDLEQYRNTVSKIEIFFLHPTDYSDI
jgi:hypothetical protein